MAVPPLPPVAVIKKCGSVNHHKCFGQAMQFDSRLAHSVEELVVWLIESETGELMCVLVYVACVYCCLCDVSSSRCTVHMYMLVVVSNILRVL